MFLSSRFVGSKSIGIFNWFFKELMLSTFEQLTACGIESVKFETGV